jgi:hypothetical protein
VLGGGVVVAVAEGCEVDIGVIGSPQVGVGTPPVPHDVFAHAEVVEASQGRRVEEVLLSVVGADDEIRVDGEDRTLCVHCDSKG